ncbi:MAG: hypothetical protein E7012_02725 [Alphaproteobacteria bacterium]|nr:hypothetical protein [Alphaproteobacteria bacterium]
MKKFLVLTSVSLISACSCMDEVTLFDNEPVVEERVQARPQNCDYFDGQTCYRYVHRVRQQPVIRYREPMVAYQAPVVSSQSCNSCNKCSVSQETKTCEDSIHETREPVEVIYKKTTYKTVYQPQTTTSVSYERVPYTTATQAIETRVVSDPITIVSPAQAQVEVITPVNAEEEILLNVK